MIPIETIHSLEKGKEYILSHTRPIYDRVRKRYRPDSDRFLYPRINKVTYCGQQLGAPHYCSICGRTSTNYHVFQTSNFAKMYISPHCIRHPSTKLWSPECPREVIEDWYSQMFEEVKVDE